ncbi:MAG: hypothetical protein R6V38_06960, partial [Roseovarius gahaiensis]
MKIFLIAGEASGDRLGAALMAGLKSLETVEFQGVGGPLMQAEGLQSLFPMDELSVMGLAEILPKYLHLRRRLHQTAEAVLQAQPDVLITIDSPDFCLRVAKLVKAKSSIRTVHYVAPSVWAWRAKRAQKMAGVIYRKDGLDLMEKEIKKQKEQGRLRLPHEESKFRKEKTEALENSMRREKAQLKELEAGYDRAAKV